MGRNRVPPSLWMVRPMARVAVSVALVLTGMGVASTAFGQAVDYGALEELFGEPVTTSATGKPQRKSDVPVTMEIITADDIRRSGATDIPGVLRHHAGVDVWRWSLGNADVAFRGYNQPMSPRILTLVNGRQVYLDFYGLTRWSNVPVALEEIRQIEVIKGPNSALYGFNAVSGVINIVTYNPLFDDKTSLALRGGTEQYGDGSAVVTQKIGDFGGIRLSAGGFHSDDYAVDDQEEPFETSPLRHWVSVDSLFQVADHVQAGAELTNTKSKQLDYLINFEPISMIIRTSSAKAHVAAETGIGLVTATGYLNHTRAEFAIEGAGRAQWINNLSVFKVEDLFKIGANDSFRIAPEFRHSTIDTAPVEGATVSYDVYAASAMWDHVFSKDVSWNNAGRVDHLRLNRDGEVIAGFPFSNDDYDEDLTAFSFSSGLTYKATDEDTLRFSISRGHLLPSLAEFGGLNASFTIGGLAAGSTGNPGLSASPVTNYEASYSRDVEQIDGEAILSAFYQKSKSLRAFSTTTGDFFPAQFPVLGVASVNEIGSSQLFGLEATLRGTVDGKWTWGVNYTYQHIRDSFNVNQAGAITHGVDFEDSIPNHKVGLHGGYKQGPWEADVFVNVVSGYDMLRLVSPRTLTVAYTVERIPTYTTFSARLAYQPVDGVTVGVTGQELLSHKETIGGKVEGRILATLDIRM